MGQFGRRGEQTSLAQPLNLPVEKSKSSTIPMIVYVAAGFSGLAGLGVHRFYGKGVMSGVKYLGILLLLGTCALFIGGNDIEPLGRILWSVMILVFLYGCVESLTWGIREIFLILKND